MSSWTLTGYLWVLTELGHKHIAYQAIQSYDKLWGKEKKSTVIQMNKYIKVFLKDSALINAAIPTQSYHHSKYVKNIWQFYIPPVLSKKWQPEWSFKGSSRLNVFWCHSILKRLTAKRLTVWVLEHEWSLMCCIYDSVATSTLGKWRRNLRFIHWVKGNEPKHFGLSYQQDISFDLNIMLNFSNIWCVKTQYNSKDKYCLNLWNPRRKMKPISLWFQEKNCFLNSTDIMSFHQVNIHYKSETVRDSAYILTFSQINFILN